MSLQEVVYPKKNMPNPCLLIDHGFKNHDGILLVSFELSLQGSSITSSSQLS
jgi:hypothetical protein